MNEILISIITVVRNNFDGLEYTQRSILEQKLQDVEWIIIDGYSTDETRHRVKKLLEQKIAIGVSEPDLGIYDAMNKGLDLSSGRFVVFLNAGDAFLDSNVLDKVANKISGNDSPDIAFFGSVMDFGGRKIERPAKAPKYIWHGQPGLHQATFFRRSIHLQHRFSMKFRICGDYDALTRMYRSGVSMKSYPDIIGINTFESNATSGRRKILLSNEAFKIQRTVLDQSLLKCILSYLMRSINSGVFKLLTGLRELRIRA